MTIYNGDTFFSDKWNVLFYRGDGSSRVVILPIGFKPVRVKPFHVTSYIVLEDNTPLLVFNDALGAGVPVKIYVEPLGEGSADK